MIEELPAAGSGPYGLRNNAVLEGSERVEVVNVFYGGRDYEAVMRGEMR